ncbi:hypothetical protein [Qipengyuania sphaerica]|uniref:hypothetical protein n=1 Tax=Qipengyuania sphaerica TaxID=2867243 RepID=UPI001C87622D|nr:hypothetical protein [Qipengyuania sphaerica]MBX7540175.1 hypothetical protein [Qipengyuania sphaerica]
MNKFLIPATLASTVLLGGCASLGGLGGLLGGDDYGYNARGDFEAAAVRACGQEASRYGRVSIQNVDQQGRDYVYVYGRIETRDYNRDEFTCVFRNDGRIVDFQTR